ncbi:P-type DNA transfer ATPase VirB11 [Rodentibacter rarus]|uniref:Type IV secretion system protein n=1 Tax=Rodentibacter rarus TaxID=1908260 RepID=A0A1V3IHA5_9PAST|nr:P-type DNA transfer ATPase VirB11 [Rodentibacter rarus]OOF40062.1 P-type DNA transfer ATPase VirB11 [Rodentibacter rarus]
MNASLNLTGKNVSILHETQSLFGEYLSMDGVTEIAVNRPNEIFIERNSHWEYMEVGQITYDSCFRFANALATYNADIIHDTKPILSSVLPSGERVQVVMYPACEKDTISITIRKPSQTFYSLDDYVKSGFFNRIIQQTKQISDVDRELLGLYQQGQYAEFLKKAVLYGKNIVIAGETGSGKTTLMKALTDYIPLDERLITIQDTPELAMRRHKNYVHLFYPSEAKHNDIITATSLLKSCLRMKPDRILLAELRSGETYDFINVISSGHNGSITSCHTGSVKETWERLIMMTLQNEQGRTLSYDVILRLLVQTIDIIVHVTKTPEHGRHITEMYFDPMRKLGVGNA